MSAALTADDILAAVTEMLIEHLCLSDCPAPDATLKSLNADSLDVVEIQMVIADEFGIDDVPDDAVSINKTVGDIADFVRRAREN